MILNGNNSKECIFECSNNYKSYYDNYYNYDLLCSKNTTCGFYNPYSSSYYYYHELLGEENDKIRRCMCVNY